MAIEDDDPKDREVWSNVARFWYNKAAASGAGIAKEPLAVQYRSLSTFSRACCIVCIFERTCAGSKCCKWPQRSTNDMGD